MANFMDAIRRTLSESTPVSEVPDQQVQPSTDDVDVTDLALGDQPINELSKRTLLKYKGAAQASEKSAAKRVDHYMRTLDPDKDEVTALDKADDTRMKRRDGRQLAHDKIMGRAKVSASEEVEPIDELSKKTLGSYVRGAAKDRSDSEYNAGYWYGQDSRGAGEYKTAALANAKKREKGMNRALKKLTGDAKVNAKEEVEPIDELSAGALRDYSKSASKDFNRRRWITTQAKTGADRKARGNRAAGITLAKDKLKNKARVNAKEEVMDELDLSMFTEEEINDFLRLVNLEESGEQLDELSKNTLKSYVKKAASDANKSGYYAGRAPRNSAEQGEEIARGRKRVTGIKRAADRLAKEETEVDEATDLKDVMKYAGGGKKFDRKALIQKKIADNNAKKAQTKEEIEMTGKSNVNEATAAQDSLSPGARSVDDPKSKFAVIQQAIGAMHAMSKDDLVKWFNDTLAQVGHEADKVGNHAASNAATLNMKPSAASASAKEDVEALFAGQDLSEEFKSSATTLFEAAVAARVAEETVRVEEAYEEALSDAISEAVEELTDQIDKYFDHAVEAWIEENEVAIESALRNELTEEFITGLRNLFLEHNINVPDENVDVVEELAARVEELEAMLDDQIAENIEFKSALLDAEIEDVVESAMEGLTLSQKEKFRTMVESIEFSGDLEELNSKLALIKKTYFTEQKKPVDSNIINETFEGDATEKVAVSDPNIARYVSAIGRTVRRP